MRVGYAGNVVRAGGIAALAMLGGCLTAGNNVMSPISNRPASLDSKDENLVDNSNLRDLPRTQLIQVPTNSGFITIPVYLGPVNISKDSHESPEIKGRIRNVLSIDQYLLKRYDRDHDFSYCVVQGKNIKSVKSKCIIRFKYGYTMGVAQRINPPGMAPEGIFSGFVLFDKIAESQIMSFLSRKERDKWENFYPGRRNWIVEAKAVEFFGEFGCFDGSQPDSVTILDVVTNARLIDK